MRRTYRIAVGAAVVASAAVAAMNLRADAQVVTPRPEDLRYQAVVSEPIATPDRRGVVAGTSALLVKDRLTQQCFVAVTIGNAMGLSPAACQP